MFIFVQACQFTLHDQLHATVLATSMSIYRCSRGKWPTFARNQMLSRMFIFVCLGTRTDALSWNFQVLYYQSIWDPRFLFRETLHKANDPFTLRDLSWVYDVWLRKVSLLLYSYDLTVTIENNVKRHLLMLMDFL